MRRDALSGTAQIYDASQRFGNCHREVWSAQGQKEHSPFGPLCQPWPAADIGSAPGGVGLPTHALDLLAPCSDMPPTLLAGQRLTACARTARAQGHRRRDRLLTRPRAAPCPIFPCRMPRQGPLGPHPCVFRGWPMSPCPPHAESHPRLNMLSSSLSVLDFQYIYRAFSSTYTRVSARPINVNSRPVMPARRLRRS